MAGAPQNVTLISAVSSFVGSEQSLSLNWRIENLERFVKLSENVYVFARLPFEMVLILIKFLFVDENRNNK